MRKIVVGATTRLSGRCRRIGLGAESRLRIAWAELHGARFGERVAFVPERLQSEPRFLSVGNEAMVGRASLLLLAPITIGERAIINDGVTLLTGEHDLADPEFALRTGPISVGRYAWICTNATILPGVTIGEGAVVAAGAVVRRDVAPFDIVAGNPAAVIGRRRTTELRYVPGAVTYLFPQ
ncbi:MAG: sugar O-acetyltransferase [Myxococcales bacterium]|nr:sugar O-acetyltransferase [Myxococcales bacterium]